MSTTPTQRIVPGAPPPPQITTSKSSQKKKKKTAGGATAVIDDNSATPSPLTGTQNLEVVTNGVSNQGTPLAPSTPAAVSPSLQKLSPIVDLITKRLKVTQKKVKRVKEYSSSGTELNEDQKRSVAGLPSLEAVVKELEEVKKAVEVHESELSKEESLKRAAVDDARKAAIEQAVAEAKAASEATARLILAFVRLPALINSSHPFVHSAEVTEAESLAIVSAVETLEGEESQSKEDIISGLFSGEGELQGVAYSRLIEIAQVVKYSHQHPSEEGAAEGAVSEPGAGAGITAHAHPGSLLFVQESELDNEIDVPVVGDNEFDVPIIGGVPPPEEPTVYEVEPEAEHKPVEVVEPTQTAGPIDWAAEDEHDLPPISGLQESFGGEAPQTPPVVDDPVPQDDGFTTHGGRGRGTRGERRGGRGGYRGEGGGHRGEAGGRGYGRDRGGRGSYRGRGDGEFRGRGEGYRGRGDGEWRGRGEGYRGRGDGHEGYRGRGDGNEGYRGRGDGHEGYRGRGDGHEGYRGRGRGRGEGRGGPPPQPQ